MATQFLRPHLTEAIPQAFELMTHSQELRMKENSLKQISLLGFAALTLSAAVLASPHYKSGIERTAWLQGCWEMTSPQRTVEEQWMAPRGGTMIAMSRTVRNGRLAGYELITLQEEGEQLTYEANPSGQSLAVFRSVVVTDSMVVFENPENDFPQRIGYRQDRTNSLMAWIEGTNKGETHRIDFTYRRVGCAGSK